jgi:Fe-S cluster biogenesis protein NfuA/nitrite reductase/ring-hydroxylating ferredoxin subunit
MPADQDFHAAADRIETLLGRVSTWTDQKARAEAEDLVREMMDLYGGAVERLLEIVHDQSGSASERIFNALGADTLVSSVLILHGLHPQDVESRVVQALDTVRPYLASHGGDVTLLGIEQDVVRLRLEGSCQSCPSSTVTMKLAVERAIEEAAPEIARIEVEGVEEAAAAPPSGLHQIGHSDRADRAKSGSAAPSWVALGMPPAPGPGGLAAVDLSGVKVVVCKVDEDWYAYRDLCPSCRSVLAGGALEADVLACPSCARRYDVRKAGGSLEGDGLHLEPLPLLDDRGALKIAVPAF